jgi:hypothetical protein
VRKKFLLTRLHGGQDSSPPSIDTDRSLLCAGSVPGPDAGAGGGGGRRDGASPRCGAPARRLHGRPPRPAPHHADPGQPVRAQQDVAPSPHCPPHAGPGRQQVHHLSQVSSTAAPPVPSGVIDG